MLRQVWVARAGSLLIGLSLGAFAAGVPLGARADDAESLQQRADALHRDAIVIDGHNDITSIAIPDFGFDLGMDGAEPSDRSGWVYWEIPWLPCRPDATHLRTQMDLARARKGGLDAQFFSVWVSREYYRPKSHAGLAVSRANHIIDLIQDQVRRHSDRLELASSADDIRRIAASGKLAALMGIEGGYAIEDDLDVLRDFYNRGVRYMTLTWDFSHSWADSSGSALVGIPRRNGGLTDFGREVVRTMNDIGMIVDVSHVSDETFWDTLHVTRAPVIASHSSARALVDNPRNLSDDMLRAISENGGVVMVNFMIEFVDPRKTSNWKVAWDYLRHPGGSQTTVSMVVDQIDHVVEIAGVDHVGLGSDFGGTLPSMFPSGLRSVNDFPSITRELLRRGYREGEIRKILGGNTLRVLEDVEHLANAANRIGR